MKIQNKINKKTGILKKIFIKICRLFGFEIIDQGNLYIPTQEKLLGENLNVPGKKSITLPLGETTITRPVTELTVIFRSCTTVNMLTQNKKRLFDKEKSEYTFRSLRSILISMENASINFPRVNFNIVIIDHNSKKSDLEKINTQLKKFKFNFSIINLDILEFENKIKKINEKNETVTKNQISNMANIYKSLLIAKKQCKDLIYFVEDDYIHKVNAINEMLSAFERISSQTKKELVLCPADYPYLYTKLDSTKIFLGTENHWRVVGETLCTFMTSLNILEKHWDKFVSMCKFEHYPFEKPLHDIYNDEYCLSPIPSLALHCTNINSVFGLSPNMNWEKIWNENGEH